MNVKKYIASGILADYCMALLDEHEAAAVLRLAQAYPEIQLEIDKNRSALESYAISYQRIPPTNVRKNILSTIANLEKEEQIALGNLPLINKFSNYQNWLKTVKPLLPASTDEDTYTKIITNEAGVFQAILWLKSYYPDEVHSKVQESALVLEGECICYIENEPKILRPGNYLEIPFNVHHDIKVTHGPVLAIIQRLKVA